MEGTVGHRVHCLYLPGMALEVGHASVLAFVLLLWHAVVVVLVGTSFTMCPVVVQAEHVVVVVVRKHRHCLHQQAEQREEVCAECPVHDFSAINDFSAKVGQFLELTNKTGG